MTEWTVPPLFFLIQHHWVKIPIYPPQPPSRNPTPSYLIHQKKGPKSLPPEPPPEVTQYWINFLCYTMIYETLTRTVYSMDYLPWQSGRCHPYFVSSNTIGSKYPSKAALVLSWKIFRVLLNRSSFIKWDDNRTPQDQNWNVYAQFLFSVPPSKSTSSGGDFRKILKPSILSPNYGYQSTIVYWSL